MNSPLPHCSAQWRWVRDRVRRSSRAPTRPERGTAWRLWRQPGSHSPVRRPDGRQDILAARRPPASAAARAPHAVTLCTLSQTQVTAPPAIARPSPTDNLLRECLRVWRLGLRLLGLLPWSSNVSAKRVNFKVAKSRSAAACQSRFCDKPAPADSCYASCGVGARLNTPRVRSSYLGR